MFEGGKPLRTWPLSSFACARIGHHNLRRGQAITRPFRAATKYRSDLEVTQSGCQKGVPHAAPGRGLIWESET